MDGVSDIRIDLELGKEEYRFLSKMKLQEGPM